LITSDFHSGKANAIPLDLFLDYSIEQVLGPLPVDGEVIVDYEEVLSANELLLISDILNDAVDLSQPVSAA